MSQTIGTIVANQGQRKMKKEGIAMQQRAQEAINKFEWQNIDDSITIRDEGVNLIAEENRIASANATDALRQGGNRAIVGGLGKVVANNNQVKSCLNQRGAHYEAIWCRVYRNVLAGSGWLRQCCAGSGLSRGRHRFTGCFIRLWSDLVDYGLRHRTYIRLSYQSGSLNRTMGRWTFSSK